MQDVVEGGLPPFIPESIPQYEYFLKDIDTPGWQWLIRGVCLAGFAVAMLVYAYYRRRLLKNVDK